MIIKIEQFLDKHSTDKQFLDKHSTDKQSLI